MLIDLCLKMIQPDKNGCLNWKWAVTSGGYGTFKLHKKSTRVHRYLLARALNLDYNDHSWVAMHRCNNKLCVNVDHLMVGNNDLNVEHSNITLKLEQEKACLI